MAEAQIIPYKQKFKSVMTAMMARKKQFSSVLPKYITIERWMGVISRSIQNNPKLLECDSNSLTTCLFQSAQLGLECDGLTREAYLVPFKVRGVQKVQLIPGYSGHLKLVRNSGQLGHIETNTVWMDDEFDYEYGSKAFLRFKPSEKPPSEKSEIRCFYALVNLKDGSIQFKVMYPWEVNRIRDKSQAYRRALADKRTDTPWIENYSEMGEKTVLIKLCKLLPKSVEQMRAIRLDEQAEAGEEQDFDNFFDLNPDDVTEVPNAEPQLPGSSESGASKLDKLSEQTKAKTNAQKPTPASSDAKLMENPSYGEGSDPNPYMIRDSKLD